MILGLFVLTSSTYYVQDGTLIIDGESSVTSTDLNAISDLYTKVYIKQGVNIICWKAFQGKSQITSLEFDESSTVSTIGEYAFQGCTGLTSLSLPSTVCYIFKHAFDGCTGLNTVYFCGKYNPSSLNGFNDVFGSSPVSTVKVTSAYEGSSFGLTQVSIGSADQVCLALPDPTPAQSSNTAKPVSPTYSSNTAQPTYLTQTPFTSQPSYSSQTPSITDAPQQSDGQEQEGSKQSGLSAGAIVAITMICTILGIALVAFVIYWFGFREKVQRFIKFTEN